MLSAFPPQSSCIPFSYWKETVSVLLGSDRTSLCAIASYIDEPFMDLDRDLLEDWPSVCTLCAGVGQGRGSLGVWTPKAGDDSTELSHPGALSPRSGCKDSTCLLSICFAWRPLSQMWGDVICVAVIFSLSLLFSSSKKVAETFMAIPDRPHRLADS